MLISNWKNWDYYEREKWRHDLRDLDNWLKRYPKVKGYVRNGCVFWIIWAGPVAPFSQAIPGIIFERCKGLRGTFEHIIKVDLKSTATKEQALGRGIMSIKYQLTIAVAKELGLLGQEYYRRKEKHDQLQYYTYGSDGDASSLEFYVQHVMVPLVGRRLSGKRYLLVLDNLQWPIETSSFMQDCGILPPAWTDSVWYISPTSHDVYEKSKSGGDGLILFDEDEDVVLSTIFALRQSAEYIQLNMIRQESIEYWHVLAIDCFHYAMVIFAKYSHVASLLTSDELIHQWATLLPRMIIEEEEEESNSIFSSSSSSKCSSMLRVGRVILEAFQKYSLLQLPFSPASEAAEATNTAAQFFAYHGLITECTTMDELADNKNKWISFSGDHGWHVSPKWLSNQNQQEKEAGGTAALILRSCSQQSPILPQMHQLFPKLFQLHVLDLSYTPLKSLPSSIRCLHNLRLLSLRGCRDLKTISSWSTTSSTDSTKNITSPLSTLYKIEILDMNGVPFSHLTQDVAHQKRNMIYLDMSYSEITTFPHSFFQDMSNLEELILVNCSNLVELPPSMALLSSLTILEIKGTQIRYFPHKIFEEMKKLQSLKLNDNKNLISLTMPISRVHGIKLEGHPNLKSFSLTGAPHIQCLSLRGCRKLESIEFKNLDSLEELDLSFTTIKELPADVTNCTQLRTLLLLGVPSLLRFPWHMLERLPEVFYLDQCTETNGNHSDQVSQLCVNDPRFFYSFSECCVCSVRVGQFFNSFCVRVTPCSTNNMRVQQAEAVVDNKLRELVKKQSTYVDVYNAEEITIKSPITVPLRRTERHVEITGMQQPPDGLYTLLEITKSISVTCDTSMENFSNWSYFPDLEECELRWCHKMVVVFNSYSNMESLRNLYVCSLKSLLWLCSQFDYSSFSSLEHLHLEDCPRLEDMMRGAVILPSLRTLDILFCSNLKNIFTSGHQLLPSLRRIRLQELPALLHFHDNNAAISAPMLKKLHVRGCWSFRCLPRLHDQLKMVKVNGERSWWRKLKWSSPLHRNSYEPKLPPKVASFDERANVTSYLR